ncbi:hypothetical protein Fot_12725 [Forsythia ovata]|uniref:Uncharacterized protein n=1 Tax=Forsythia ovata TaxID=205694 RepID=A0ABD1W1F3_9LAMI
MLIMWMQPASDGSDSKVTDTLRRASATPFSPQSCFSSGVLSHSGVNIGGLSHGVQHAAGSTSSRRFSVCNPHNALSQVSRFILMHCRDAYPTRYPLQQHRASSSGVSGNRDLHFRGFEPSHSYFTNQFMDKDMELQGVPNQFGMHCLIKIIRKGKSRFDLTCCGN